MTDIFHGIGDASAPRSKNYSRQGHYHAEILSVELSQRGPKASFIINMRIVKVLNTFEEFTISGEKVQPHVEGEEVKQVWTNRAESFLGNIKGFIMGATNSSAQEVDEEDAKAVVQADQPLAGTVIEVEFHCRTNKDGTGNWTEMVTKRALAEG